MELPFAAIIMAVAVWMFGFWRRGGRKPPDVDPLPAGSPDSSDFWRLVERAGEVSDSPDSQAAALTSALARSEPEGIVSFDAWIRDRLDEAYRWDLWAVAYIVNGGCSDDGFEYFRAWLLSRGQESFDRAMGDPESAAEGVESGDETDAESILYAAAEAYEKATGQQLPPTDRTRLAEPTGERWSEEAVDDLYPDLARRFS